jgi:hypothetical protein
MNGELSGLGKKNSALANSSTLYSLENTEEKQEISPGRITHKPGKSRSAYLRNKSLEHHRLIAILSAFFHHHPG